MQFRRLLAPTAACAHHARVGTRLQASDTNVPAARIIADHTILDELLSILARKFSRDAEELPHVAVFLSDLALFVKPRRRLQVAKDEPDNRILECALAGRAEAIVTGDRALLALREYDGVRIISLRDYLGRAASDASD